MSAWIGKCVEGIQEMSLEIESDIDWLYEAARKIGKIPNEDTEERFVELVGKKTNDDVALQPARLWAFREIYGW